MKHVLLKSRQSLQNASCVDPVAGLGVSASASLNFSLATKHRRKICFYRRVIAPEVVLFAVRATTAGNQTASSALATAKIIQIDRFMTVR